MKRLNNKGFSMIELLVVLLIIGILAAVAAPMFLASADKAKAAEAVSGVGSIRSALRVYAMQHGGVASVQGLLPMVDNATYSYFSGGATLGLDLRNGKYFSPGAYSVVATTGETDITNPVEFVVVANGASSGVNGASGNTLKASTDGNARSATEVRNVIVKMDNSGAVVYSTSGGTGTTPYQAW